jgi:putative cell wall-binding protein
MTKLRVGSLLLLAALLVAAIPATVDARPSAETTKRPATRIRQSAAQYALDRWEASPSDDTPADATDLTSLFGTLGGGLYEQRHTISLASTSSAVCDSDWYRFDVTPADMLAGASFLLEADSRANANVAAAREAIEVYGPGLSQVKASVPPPVASMDSTLAASFSDWWHDAWHVTSLPFVPPSAGTYYFRVRPWRNPADGTALANFANAAGPYTLRVKKGFATRVWGSDRIVTAVTFSREQYPAGSLNGRSGSAAFGDSVVIASGWNYPDALAGSALAGQVKGPLLLTAPRALSPALSAEIERLKPKHIYILGGTTAVSSAVETALEGLPKGAHAKVIRLSGRTRIGTAVTVAQTLHDRTDPATPLRGAFVVNGWSYADALSASPLASLNRMPILLTHAGFLDTATREALADYGITDVILVGGTNALKPKVEADLARALGGAGHVRRIAGADRYDTSREFAAWASGLRAATGAGWPELASIGTTANPSFMRALNPTTLGVASGASFPDALSGGAWCGAARSPLLLTPPHTLSPYIYSTTHVTPAGGDDYWTDVMNATSTGLQRCYLFGGPSAVDTATLRALDVVTGAGGGS